MIVEFQDCTGKRHHFERVRHPTGNFVDPDFGGRFHIYGGKRLMHEEPPSPRAHFYDNQPLARAIKKLHLRPYIQPS